MPFKVNLARPISPQISTDEIGNNTITPPKIKAINTPSSGKVSFYVDANNFEWIMGEKKFWKIVSKSANYTIQDDDDVVKVNASANAVTITLPDTIEGRKYTIKKIDSSANVVTVDEKGSDTIDGALTYALSLQWKYITVVASPNNWFIIGQN